MGTAITKRLGIMGIDFDSVTLACIFRVFESVVGDSVVKAQLYLTDCGESYSIVEFKDIGSAKEAYDFCDGMEVEKTGNVFDLSFVPEDADLDSPVEECESSKDFVYNRAPLKRAVASEDMIQLSDDQAFLDIEIPEEYKTRIQDESLQVTKAPDVTIEDGNTADMRKALDEGKHVDELEGFQFDVNDERFADLFEDDDFTLDASNKGFRLQKTSKDIFNEKLRHHGQK